MLPVSGVLLFLNIVFKFQRSFECMMLPKYFYIPVVPENVLTLVGRRQYLNKRKCCWVVFIYACDLIHCFPQVDNAFVVVTARVAKDVGRQNQNHWASRLSGKTASLHWQILTIVLWRDGFENCNKPCMVAHFYSEAVLCMRYTFSSYRDGRLFCRYNTQSWWVWGKLCHRTLCRFISLLVEKANCTTWAGGGEVRFGMSRLHTKASCASQDGAAHVLIPCLRKRVDELHLQGQTLLGLRKYFKLFFSSKQIVINDLTLQHKSDLSRRSRGTRITLDDLVASAR